MRLMTTLLTGGEVDFHACISTNSSSESRYSEGFL
jgi:hypothetical protein